MRKGTKKLMSGMIGMLLAVAMVMTNFAGLGPEPQKAKAATMQGTGESSDPYEISTYAQLKEFADIVNGTNGHVQNVYACAILTADIICTDELWVPIADYGTNSTNKYYGTFNGKGHKIIGLSNKEISNVNNLNYQGLFGYIEKIGATRGSVQNVGLEGGSITGKDFVVDVAGYNYGSISNCYNTGTVTGADGFVGGVAGYNKGSISNSYNTGTISGANEYVGGVAGDNGPNGSISNCYNTGAVTGVDNVGGVAGHNNEGSISNCYNTGAVSGAFNNVGGVAGYNFRGSISNCYNTGAVTGADNHVGGVAGRNANGSISYCYNVGEGSITLNDLTGLNALDKFSYTQDETNPWLKRDNDANNYFYPHLNGVNFDAITPATANDGSSVDVKDWPARVLRYTGETDPYEISDYNMLKQFASIVNDDHTSVCAVLTNDIVCTDELWTPIGNLGNKFTGTFDGNGHKIIGLSNKEISGVNNLDYQGLFGYIEAGGSVQNVGLEGGSITGNIDVGGVAGYIASDGSISNSYNTGAVSGAYYVGGVAGYIASDGSISNSYNAGAVTGTGYYVGGVAGYIASDGSISNSYNAGAVTGTGDYVGGVAGFNFGSISNCYNTGAVSGANDVGGVATYNNGSISNCYNTGAVSGANDVGGVAGYNFGSISNCFNAGAVSGAGNNVGGVAGVNESGNITGCSEKILNELTGSGALSSMGFDYTDSEWMIKADAECDGKNYWFYPHLKGFDKDENGVQIIPENIPADKWPAKVEISICGVDSKTYDKTEMATSVIANKPIIPDGKTAKYSVLNGTIYTGEYAVMPTEPGSYKVSIYDSETASTPSDVKYFNILSAGEGYTVPYKYMTGTDTNGEPVWENRTVSETVNAGTYRAVIDFGTGHLSFEKQFTITSRPITVTPNNVSKEFGSLDPELTYTVEGLLDGDSLTGSLSRTTGEYVAEYDITLGNLSKPDNNYSDITFITGKKLTITPKALGSEAIRLSSEEFEYNGTARTPNVTVYDGETVVPASEYSVNITGNVNAGTATVEVSDVNGGNYTVSGTKTFAITKAKVTVSGITAKDKVYDGNDTAELDLSNVTLTGVLDADRENVSATATGKFENANAGKNKKVIISDLELTGTAVANYSLSDTGNQTETAAEISKLDSGINGIPSAKSDLVYTGETQELINAITSDDGTVSYALGTDATTVPTDTEFTASVPTGKNAGTYYVWYRVTGDGNHNNIDAIKITTEIAPLEIKDLTVILDNTALEENGEEQSVSVIGVKSGDTELPGDSYEVSGTLAAKDAGTYTVTVKLTGNYSGSGLASWTIAPKQTVSGGVWIYWEDFDNFDSLRPSDVTVTLLNGTQEVSTVTLSGDNLKIWNKTVELPKYTGNAENDYTWIIKDSFIPAGYTLTNTESKKSETGGSYTEFTLTHIPETISYVTVTVVPGKNMEYETASGKLTQKVKSGEALDAINFQFGSEYSFPADFSIDPTSDIVLEINKSTIVISGKPSKDITIQLPDLVKKSDGSNTGTNGSEGTNGTDNGGTNNSGTTNGTDNTGTTNGTNNGGTNNGANSNSGTTNGTGNGGNSSSGTTTGSGKDTTGTTSGSGAGTNGTTDKDKDTDTSNTVITKNEDGSETATTVITSEDGSKTTTAVTTNEDGSKTSKVETEYTDGSKVETVEKKDADGAVTETTVKTNTDGSTETTEVEKDADGNVLVTTTETSTVDKKKNVTVTSKSEYADGSSVTSEVETTKKGTVTSKVEYVESNGTVTNFESSYKKNGAGGYTSVTTDAAGNVISSTTSTTTVSKKNNTVTTTESTENEDGSKTEYKEVTDKKGNTEINEITISADNKVTTTNSVINSDGSGTSTTVIIDAEGKELSRTEATTTVDKKGNIKTVSVTTNADGSTKEVTEKVYSSGTVKISKTQADVKGNTSEITEKIKTTKKGNLSIDLNKIAKKVGKKSTKTTKTDGKVFVYKSGNVKITLTVTKSNGKTKTKTVKLKAENVDFDVSDIDELAKRYM